MVFKLKDGVGSLVYVKFSSPVGVASEAIISDIDFALILSP